MLISQTLNQRQTLVMTTRMQAAVRILGTSNQALGEHLESAARDNPYLDLRLPSSFRGGQSDFHALTAGPAAVVGFDGVLRSSTDGTTWTTRSIPASRAVLIAARAISVA